MYTLLIHRKYEPTKNLTLNNLAKNQTTSIEYNQSIKAGDLAGLSWILLKKGDEI